jgi:hypothetical protein
MRLDAQNCYSDAQAVTADARSTNNIDHGADRNLGLGEPMSVFINVDVAAAGGGTLNIQLRTDDASSFGSPTVVAQTGALADTVLVAGTTIVLALPANTVMEQFSELYYDVTTMTGITLSAWLLPSTFIPSGNVFYPDAITIS